MTWTDFSVLLFRRWLSGLPFGLAIALAIIGNAHQRVAGFSWASTIMAVALLILCIALFRRAKPGASEWPTPLTNRHKRLRFLLLWLAIAALAVAGPLAALLFLLRPMNEIVDRPGEYLWLACDVGVSAAAFASLYVAKALADHIVNEAASKTSGPRNDY